MEVLIVSRTRMKNGVCCGGIDLANGEFIRLHDHWGKNLTESVPFQIGDVYDLDYRTAVNCRPIPHIEDKEVLPDYKKLKQLTVTEFIDEIDRLVDVPNGSIETIFEGKLRRSHFTRRHSPV